MKSYLPFAQPCQQSVAISCLVLLALLSSACATPQTPTVSSPRVSAHNQTSLQPASGLLPSGFVPNAGHLDPIVAYQGLGFASGLFFTASEIVLSLSQEPSTALPDSSDESPAQGVDVVSIQFLGTNLSSNLFSQGPLSGKVGFFLGSDSTRWRGLMTVYSSLTYAQLYPGIDLRYENNDGALKGTYTMAPGADPSKIRWRYSGDVVVSLDDSTGRLLVKAADGRLLLSERAPLAWQSSFGERSPVHVRYKLAADGSLGFDIGSHDPSLPLTIDPTIAFSTYLGGNSSDGPHDVAVDTQGNAFIAGSTASSDFPSTTTLPRGMYSDVFVTKLSPDGQSILYSAIFGGNGADVAKGIALDSTGKAYITGYTCSTNFPLQNALQDQFVGGDRDAFISVLDLNAGTLHFSTYLGGSGYEYGASITVSPGNNIIIGGTTLSADFPFIQSALDTTLGGPGDGFVTAIDSADFAIVFNTYFGGSGYDNVEDLVIGNDKDIYLTGSTSSLDFYTVNPLQGSPGGGNCWLGACYDAFISHLASDGTELLFSTYLGGSDSDFARELALDSQSNLYVLGQTNSLDFPLQNPLQETLAALGEIGDFFIAKISKSGDSLLYSTYLGGRAEEQAGGIAVDSAGRAFITGDSTSYCIPLLTRERSNGYQDALLVALSPDGQNIDFYTYLRGEKPDRGLAMDFDPYGNLFLVGTTQSTDFFTLNALDDSLSGSEDGFVAKLGNHGPSVLPEQGQYLPLVYHPQPTLGIYGYVNHDGCGLAGIPLELRFFNGSSWSTRATTVTASDGLFSFPNVASLAPGQKYYVRYINSNDVAYYLSYWETRALTAYMSGTNVLIGDFALENVGLTKPPNGSQQTLPTTFEWSFRYLITTDSFEFNLLDPNDPSLDWWTNPLGYTENYILTNLPSGYHNGAWYLWYVGIFGADGGYGTSYWAQWVCFTSGCGSLAQANPPLVSLQSSPLNWPEALSQIESQAP